MKHTTNKLYTIHRIGKIDNGLSLLDCCVLLEIWQLAYHYTYATTPRISDNLEMSYQSIFQRVQRLVKLGFVTILPTPNVYQSNEIKPTAKGNRLSSKINRLIG